MLRSGRWRRYEGETRRGQINLERTAAAQIETVDVRDVSTARPERHDLEAVARIRHEAVDRADIERIP